MISPIGSRPAKSWSPVLVVFVDGVGLTVEDERNPFVSLDTPGIDRVLGGSLVMERLTAREGMVLDSLDATLGVAGLPQSATGQTALFTGINAARRLGRHVAAFPGPRLRSIIEADGLLRKARRGGRRVAFVNAFPPDYLRSVQERKRRHSVTAWAALSAGLSLFGLEDLLEGRALTWDLERDYVSRFLGRDVPRISVSEAASDLAALAMENDLTLYETFLPDLAGHRRGGLTVTEAVRRLDGFLGALAEARPSNVTLIVVSDHGNVEEPDHTRHTRNPVPLLALGPGAGGFRGTDSLTGVAPRILETLGVQCQEQVP